MEDLFTYSNSETLFEYYSKLESIIVYNDTKALNNLGNDFKEYLKEANLDTTCLADITIVEQFDTLLCGISKYYSQSPEDSYEFFVNAMKYTNPIFGVGNFAELKYTTFELRILLLIALSVASRDELELSNKILEFVLVKSNQDIKATLNEKFLIVKIYFNLSYNYHRLKLYQDALVYAQKGIDYCNNNFISYALAGLLYRKGIAEFLTEQPDYLKTLELSISMLLINKQEQLAKNYSDIAFKYYNIKICNAP